MSSLPLAALGAGAGFRTDPRFGCILPPPVPADEPQAEDPLARAWADGHAAGRAEALGEAAARADADAAARGQIELSLARLNAEQTELLRQRLFAAVEALCEAAIAPLALDQAAFAARIERAAAMLSRADDARVLRLHPDDIALLGKNLPAGLEIAPDPALERGALRIDAATGGVEDGPAHWRRAIAEALSQC